MSLVRKVAGTNPEPFSTSRTSNWVARAGGLPTLIQHVAHDLVDGGTPEALAIPRAIGIVKNWAAGHDGKGNAVKPETVAEAAKAIAEWEKMKATSHVGKATDEVLDAAVIGATLAVGDAASTLSKARSLPSEQIVAGIREALLPLQIATDGLAARLDNLEARH